MSEFPKCFWQQATTNKQHRMGDTSFCLEIHCSLAGKLLTTSFVFGRSIALICGKLQHHHTSYKGVGSSLLSPEQHFFALLQFKILIGTLFATNWVSTRLITALFLFPLPIIHLKVILLPAFCRIVTTEKLTGKNIPLICPYKWCSTQQQLKPLL